MESVYPSTKRSALQLLAGYLERARQFEFLAGETKDDPRFKRMLLRQVVAYRMLAVKRADKLHLPIPRPRPQGSQVGRASSGPRHPGLPDRG